MNTSKHHIRSGSMANNNKKSKKLKTMKKKRAISVNGRCNNSENNENADSE